MTTTFNPRLESAENYVASLRSRAKKAYAERYRRFLMCPAAGEPSSSDLGLGYMAAQAVRLQLQSIFNS